MFVCGMSGKVPEEAVVDKRTGQVYERRLIERYIEEHGRDPETHAAMSKDDLVAVRVRVDRALTLESGMSVGSLIGALQREWETTMVEMAELREGLSRARRELAVALYEKEAATQVIARLLEEQEQSRKRSRVDPSESTPTSSVPDPSAVAAELTARGKELTTARVSFQTPSDTATETEVGGLSHKHEFRGHLATKRGVLSVDLAGEATVLSGGVDGKVVVSRGGSVVCKHSQHTAPVRAVAFASPTAETRYASASEDGVVHFWRSESPKSAASSLDLGKGPLRTLHAATLPGIYVASAHSGAWALLDARMDTARVVLNVADATSSSVEAAALHPDGLLYARAFENGHVRLWDVRKGIPALALGMDGRAHASRATGIAFSEQSGLWAVSASEDGQVARWDLRKPNQPIGSLTLPDAGLLVSDRSCGRFFAAGGSKLRVLALTQDSSSVVLLCEPEGGPTQAVTSAVFGPRAHSLVVGSMDNLIHTFGTN